MKVTKRLRQKVSTKDFMEERLEHFMCQEKHLNDFYLFKCEPLFVGRESAKVNTYIYEKKIGRVQSQIKWYLRKIKAKED